MKFSDERLNKATELTDEQCEVAAEVAPRLRMLHKGRTARASVITFDPAEFFSSDAGSDILLDSKAGNLRGVDKKSSSGPCQFSVSEAEIQKNNEENNASGSVNNRTTAASAACKCPEKDEFLKPYVLAVPEGADFVKAFEDFTAANGHEPLIVLAEGLAFALGSHMEAAAKVAEVFLAHAAGEAADWTETEETSSDIFGKRLEQKIMIVTGAAQGFGLGIAQAAAANGAYVVLADLAFEQAQASSAEINEKFGPFASTAVKMDVTNEDMVRAAINRTAAEYGGLDVFQANAGVLSAGATDTLPLEKFMFVTNINYVGYFICAKQAFILMKKQHEIVPDYMMDIIQTNSKSGLEGSKKNCSYAGSKFGTIGLTQSFALEMAEFNIKVNSICPGNFMTGPLWTDPERGLLVQYLRSGKVKGAKTTEDVADYYNSKVPLGRGCEPEDVAKAILYVIEQKYETGQAIPVTGGQVMLN